MTRTGTARTAWGRLLAQPEPLLAMAPMQDVTHAAFWRILIRFGGPDLFFTEFFRVHAASRLDRDILRSITNNPTGRPVVAQLVGTDAAALARTARELSQHPVAAIDLNAGCPVPVVSRKGAGGGLLRDLGRLEAILGALRDAIALPLTVKIRLGWSAPEECERWLPLVSRHGVDLVTVHGRTVQQMYGGAVHYDWIARAVAGLSCPVLANGDIGSFAQADRVLAMTGARGVMVGRGAIRNPWIFRQIREHRSGGAVGRPTGRMVLGYLRELYAALASPGCPERAQVERFKKYANFIGTGIEPTGRCLHRIQRAASQEGLFGAAEEYLDHDRPLEPLAGPG